MENRSTKWRKEGKKQDSRATVRSSPIIDPRKPDRLSLEAAGSRMSRRRLFICDLYGDLHIRILLNRLFVNG